MREMKFDEKIKDFFNEYFSKIRGEISVKNEKH